MRPLRLIIAGSRGITDRNMVERILNGVRSPIDHVISGDARGIDNIGALWAESKGIPVIHFPAKWDLYGKSAGYRRNVDMAKYAVGDPQIQGALVAIWDGKSPGTEHMVNIAKEHQMLVWVPDLIKFRSIG